MTHVLRLSTRKTEIAEMTQKPDPHAAELAALKREHNALYHERCRAMPRRGVFEPGIYYTLSEISYILELRKLPHLREALESCGCELSGVCGKHGAEGSRITAALERGPCDDTSESGQPS